MGVIADAMVEYAQLLLDKTDGSEKEIHEALSISQMCWHLALLPKSEQEEMLDELRRTSGMDDAEFADFRKTLIAPMILRHHQMFPDMPRIASQIATPASLRKTKYPGTGRNASCPCSSGQKYKHCCGSSKLGI